MAYRRSRARYATSVRFAGAAVAMVMVVVVSARGSLAARQEGEKRDTHCGEDWPCIRKEMLEVIEEEFSVVGNQSGTDFLQVIETSTATGEYAATPGWFRCSMIDFGSFRGLENAELQKQIADLSVDVLCNPETGSLKDDATCLAFYAAINATYRLRDEFEAGPRFWKYAATNWFEGGTGWTGDNVAELQLQLGSYVTLWKPDFYTYPSWYADSVVNVTYGDGAPTISMADTSDVASWMLCEMLITTLTISNNQVASGTCGPSAVLASMFHIEPAQAIKKALQVGWTGSFGDVEECDFIYDLAPGVVPYKSFQPGYNGTLCYCESPNTLEDCQSTGGSYRPCQAVGIEEMWTQLMLSSSYKTIVDECPDDLRLFTAGVAGERFETILRLQQSTYMMVAYFVERVFGVPASIIMNVTYCDGIFQEGACTEFPLAVTGTTTVAGIFNGTLTEMEAQLENIANANLTDAAIEDMLSTGSLDGTTLLEGVVAVLDEQLGAILPNVTKRQAIRAAVNQTVLPRKILDPSMMEDICSHDVAILAVLGDLVEDFGYTVDTAQNKTIVEYGELLGRDAGWTAGTQCDHWVYLVGGKDGCFLGPDGNVFKVFSWGQYRYATLDAIIYAPDSLVCLAIVADV